MARPVASKDWMTTLSVCTNVSGMSARGPLPRWRSARPDPHKGAGLVGPFCARGFRDTGRLSGHLPLTTRSLRRRAVVAPGAGSMLSACRHRAASKLRR